ncbi:MAG TPA: carbohydrate ABC transporter permease, partial [Sphaerochaeta sp.]|nr:carbohydrate ABC transporter permease [Sphaerochaeta sp.]
MKKRIKMTRGSKLITLLLILFCVVWTIPTAGILITSFRDSDATASSGWWTAFSNLKDFTFQNYDEVLGGQRFTVGTAGGGTAARRGASMG